MSDEKITRMRGLGRFFGHVWGAVTTPAEGGERRRVEVRRDTEEQTRDGVTLRRTTIEEIELPGAGRPEDGR